MIVKHEFDTDNPDHRRDLAVQQMAEALWLATLDFREELRAKAKYQGDEHAQYWMQRFQDYLTARNVDLDL